MLKNQEALLRGQDHLVCLHDVALPEHSAQLGSLMTSVTRITKSLQALHTEVREGFQLQKSSPTQSGSVTPFRVLVRGIE
ncbi:hypothetical protein MtrunA17_Chr2g0283781 [Medicago truncatula]|uniref:Uncharacterized protein n=1 Tax=Medicago truncatula TaxID=3880 RepID=A0A072VEI2_MEDTR|nr:hypothetical protein MTR_2g015970 [Medicago truncatula]RHN72080.1 hypothetical protein MtrunA17_Chr2g0283781 [Medicago truncatula]